LRLSASILFFLAISIVYGQVKNIGVPDIINYSKSIYAGGTQNWGISRDTNGFMYFANNEGILLFNGLQWKTIKVSQTKPVRSIFTDSKNTTYVGVLNDFGYLMANHKGLMEFVSLRFLLPANIKDFDEIWRIYEIPEGIVFQTFEYVFILNNEDISVIEPKDRFHFSFNVNGRLFIQEPNLGVYELVNGIFEKVNWPADFTNDLICDILHIRDDHFIICTSGNGLFEYDKGKFSEWDTNLGHLAKKYKLYSAVRIGDNQLAFGSILNGLLFSDFNGNLIQHINSGNGMQNNTVLSLFSPDDGNLWVGLDNGIDFIDLNSPITYLTAAGDLGTGYCAMIFKNKIYLGTNQGLFYRKYNEHNYSEGDFHLVENTTGQVWSLNIYDDQLICGHNLGTFVIKDDLADLISSEKGAWKYITLHEDPRYLLGGHYNGLILLHRGINGWAFKQKVKGFDESCRYLEQDDQGYIWVSHGAKGVFRIRLNENMNSVEHYALYNSANGLPSDGNNIVMKLFGQIIISTVNGIYRFDEDSEIFQPFDDINELFRLNGRLKTLVEKEGDIWFVAQNESGLLRLNEDNSYTKITLPFKQLNDKYVNEFEFVYPYSQNDIFVAIDDGFAHYSASLTKSYTQPLKAFITEVELPYLDSVIGYANLTNRAIKFIFPFKRNSFRFHFTSPFYEDPEHLKFSYLLENYSAEWSEWSDLSFKDFTNLHEGKYVIKVKAKNIYGTESAAAEFGFTILPPWRRSSSAYYLYAAMILIALLAIGLFIQYRMKSSKLKEQEKHQKELKNKQEQYELNTLMTEKEIVRLRNEKLRAEMTYRNKELANQTMNIIQKNKFLSEMKESLLQLKKAARDEEIMNSLSILSRNVDKEIDNKKQDKVFKTYFEEVHKDFFERLREQYPNLSPRELHLCAYIRMNLSSKEIAALFNISERGVEISRYRLRKKLNLPREVNLSVFLSNF
jgi:DNA-binding CsgD family transcriptional regulator/ligand-binding sensor domain-containing protein